MGISQQIGASSLIKAGVIDNTAARPASPYEGQVIYQKDTDEILAYNGTSWTRPRNMPWGIVAIIQNGGSGSVSLPAATAVTLLTAPTFTAVANRYYKISWQEPEIWGGSGTIALTLRNGGTVLMWKTYSGAGNYYAGFCSTVTTLAAGPVTITAVATASNTGSTYRGSGGYIATLVIEDIGPA